MITKDSHYSINMENKMEGDVLNLIGTDSFEELSRKSSLGDPDAMVRLADCHMYRIRRRSSKKKLKEALNSLVNCIMTLQIAIIIQKHMLPLQSLLNMQVYSMSIWSEANLSAIIIMKFLLTN